MESIPENTEHLLKLLRDAAVRAGAADISTIVSGSLREEDPVA
jgi:hypothetical protein